MARASRWLEVLQNVVARAAELRSGGAPRSGGARGAALRAAVAELRSELKS